MTESRSFSSALRLSGQLGVVVLMSYGAFYWSRPADDTVIAVTPLLVEELAQRQEALLGRILTDVEREAVVEDYIEEEMLVREALKRGLDRGDRRIRPMLVSHARAELLRSVDYESVLPPREDLEARFEQSPGRYRLPERVALEQVFYPFGAEPESLGQVLSALRGGAAFTEMGDAGPSAVVSGLSTSEIAQAYGLDFAESVFALEAGGWDGPLISSAGTHFVRVTSRSPTQMRSFEEVEPYVMEDFQLEAEVRALDDAMKPLRRRYRVVIEADPG